MSQEFHQGEGEFKFTNGDKYEGKYCAHVSGLAWREGAGAYLTHDGQIYKGNWKDDKLNETENVRIIFQNRDQYRGKIHKYKYEGPGTYSFGQNHLTGNFENNKPTGEMIYIDDHNQLWFGKAESEYVLLTRELVFFTELDAERGKGQPLYKTETAEMLGEDSEQSRKPFFDQKELEKLVFAKSLKTDPTIDFQESEWLQAYLKSENLRRSVANKTKCSVVLTEEEKTWFQNQKKSQKILQSRKSKKLRKPHNDLLRHHFEEEMRNTCPPVKIFYPTQHSQEEFDLIEFEG